MLNKTLSFSVLPLINNFDHNYLKELKSIGLEWIHYDVMDDFTGTKGFDVDNLPFLIEVGYKVNVHLMVNQIATNLLKFVKHAVNGISFHVESLKNLKDGLKFIEFIQSHNIKAGIAFKFDTDLWKYRSLIQKCDYVTLMSVVPGKGGQKFNPEVFKTILELNKIVSINYYQKPLIEIDGGIDTKVLKEVWKYADIFVSGSAFFNLDLAQKKALIQNFKNSKI